MQKIFDLGEIREAGNISAGKIAPSGLDRPHATALRAMEILAADPAPLHAGISQLRQHHATSRRPLLAPLEAVHSVVNIHGAPGVPHLTVIRPAGYEAGKDIPALIFLHGGGWTFGAYESYEPFCRQLANATGSILIWVEYRLAPEHPFPAAFDDTQAALHWVHDNAARLGVDPHRIMLGGDSAGGNLAAAVCLAEQAARSAYQPWRQILLYPCLDLTAHMPSHRLFAEGYLLTASRYAWFRANYIKDELGVKQWALSPLFAAALAGLPPTVILHAGFDPLRDEAAAYGVRLMFAGVPLKTLYFPDMIHGFLTMGGVIPAADAAVTRIAQALEALA